MRVRDIDAFMDKGYGPARSKEYDPTDERVMSISVSIDGPALARLDELCDKHSVTRSKFVRAALRRYFHVLDRRKALSRRKKNGRA